jgi:hypothetical protein
VPFAPTLALQLWKKIGGRQMFFVNINDSLSFVKQVSAASKIGQREYLKKQ